MAAAPPPEHDPVQAGDLNADANARKLLRSLFDTAVAAADPANPYGAALPWPSRDGLEGGHRPGRKAGAVVVLVGGALVWYLERGGRSLLTFSKDSEVLAAAAYAYSALITDGRIGGITIERINGVPALHADAPLMDVLLNAGFSRNPRGIRLRR